MSRRYPRSSHMGVDFDFHKNDRLREDVPFLSHDFPVSMYTQAFCYPVADYVPFHWHDECQATWVSSKELEYCVNGETFPLTGSKLLLLNSRRLHSSRTVSADVGYNQISYSIEQFRSAYGLSPLKYRNKYGKGNDGLRRD